MHYYICRTLRCYVSACRHYRHWQKLMSALKRSLQWQTILKTLDVLGIFRLCHRYLLTVLLYHVFSVLTGHLMSEWDLASCRSFSPTDSGEPGERQLLVNFVYIDAECYGHYTSCELHLLYQSLSTIGNIPTVKIFRPPFLYSLIHCWNLALYTVYGSLHFTLVLPICIDLISWHRCQ